MTNQKHTKHYLCETDYRHEMEMGMASFYDSLEDLQKHSKCWQECGVVAIILDEAGDEVSHSWVIDEERDWETNE